MDHATLALAREDWTHGYADYNPSMTLCADDLIALAVDHKRQASRPATPLTPEDIAILMRRCPKLVFTCAGDGKGAYAGFNNDKATLAYVRSLNI